MEKYLTRRHALSGAIALAAVAAAPLASAAASGSTDETADLDNLFARWKALYDASEAEGKALSALEEELGRTAPRRPAILTQAVLRPDGSVYDTTFAREYGWDLKYLESSINSKTRFQATRIDEPNGDYLIKCREEPVQAYFLAQYKERRDVRLQFDAAYEAHFAEHERLESAWTDGLDIVDAARQQIIDYPVVTLPGLSRKAALFAESPWFARHFEYEICLEAADALVQDIARIAQPMSGRA